MWSNNGIPSSANAAAASPSPPLESVVLGKRKANDTTTQHDSERFAKRFNLLSLEANARQHSHSNSNYYLPVSHDPTSHDAAASPSEPMSLDDSRHRVYISNLDSEFASIAASETALVNSQKLIFLPDIERHFNQLPREMLRLQNGSPGSSNASPPLREHEQAQELVLYTLPRTLTQEGEGANETRKAILEARQRAREKALLEARAREMNAMYSSTTPPGGNRSGGGGAIGREEVGTETAHGYGVEGYEEWRDAEEGDQDDDDDVMDMD